jgi:hypothetical protein
MSIINLLIDEYEVRTKKNDNAKKQEVIYSDLRKLYFNQDTIIPDDFSSAVPVDDCCASTGESFRRF